MKNRIAPAGAAVVLRGERLREQQAAARVDGVAAVQLVGRELLQGLRAAAGVVGDDDVDVPEGPPRGLDDPGRGGRVAEVRADVLGPATGGPDRVDHGLGAVRIGAPRLLGVVRNPGVHDDGGAVPGQPAGDRGPDRDPPADPGDEGDPALQRERHPGCPLVGVIAANHGGDVGVVTAATVSLPPHDTIARVDHGGRG